MLTPMVLMVPLRERMSCRMPNMQKKRSNTQMSLPRVHRSMQQKLKNMLRNAASALVKMFHRHFASNHTMLFAIMIHMGLPSAGFASRIAFEACVTHRAS